MPCRNVGISRRTLIVILAFFFVLTGGWATTAHSPADKIQDAWKNITEPALMNTILELCSEKYAGRLTGTRGYDDAAAWLAGRLAAVGLTPGGDNGTFFQEFPNPYTLVLPGAELSLLLPAKDGSVLKKSYVIETDFFPGSTSGSGEVSAEVVYVGYGITAPELGFDEYAGLDVKGKIVLVEVEVPVDPGRKPDEFARWRPYSFHQYKVRNAREHGAAGMLYHYPIVNPNCLYIEDLIMTGVGRRVVEDIFRDSGREHDRVVGMIKKKRRPQSFATGRTVFMKNVTEHHAEGIGRNVIAYLPGSDSLLKDETVILSAHLDHLGLNPSLMPGANDNASGVAVVMAVAEALVNFEFSPRRTVVFLFFGAEEQGVRGSEFYLEHPPRSWKRTKALINLDGAGRGKKIYALAAKNYPALWKFFVAANRALVPADLSPEYFHNRARPRLDAARFMWAGIPSVSFSVGDAPELPYPVYHTRNDRPEILTPAIMVDLGKLIFAALVGLAPCR